MAINQISTESTLCTTYLLTYYLLRTYRPQNRDSVFTDYQKYIFNVHQIATSAGKFNIFLARHGQKYRCSEFTKAPFQANLSGDWVRGGVRSTAFPPTKPSGSAPASPQNYSQIYVTGRRHRADRRGTVHARAFVILI